MSAGAEMSAVTATSSPGGAPAATLHNIIHWRLALAMTLFAAVLHLSSARLLPGFIHPNDSASYLVPAESLRHSGAFLNARAEPDTFRTPGYPAFLALLFLIGLKVPGVVYLQHIIAALLAGATAAAAGVVLKSRTAAWAAGILVAIDVATLQLANWVMTEILAATLISAAAGLAYLAASAARQRYFAILCGLLCGIATLMRPAGILLGAALAAFLLLCGEGTRARRAGSAALLLGLSLALPIGWVGRNYVETHHAMLSSVASLNMLEYRAAGVLATHDTGDFEANRVRHREELLAAACGQIEHSLGRPCSDVSMADRAPTYSNIARTIITHDIAGYVKSAMRGVGMMLFGNSASSVSAVFGVPSRVAKLLCLAITVPVFAFATIGICYVRRNNRKALWLAITTVL